MGHRAILAYNFTGGEVLRMSDKNQEKEDKINIALPDGTLADAYEVDFDIESEPWTTVKLSDGTTLKIRIGINKIFRLDRYDPINGEPAYFVQSGPIIRTQVPGKLRKKLQPSKPGNQEIA